MLKTLSIAAGLLGLAATMPAQTYPDTFEVDYYSNANGSSACSGATGGNAAACQVPSEPDATVRLTNVGTQIGNKADPSGDLCAMVYVLTPDQQLAECCGCALTPDALLTLSVNRDLTSNPLTPVTPTTGDIKIISSLGAPNCNPSKPVPVAGIRAWATHIQRAAAVLVETLPSFETETAFSDSTLSVGELNTLRNKCKAIQNNGSGFGICTCGTGEIQ
jgi:hypothetical protein